MTPKDMPSGSPAGSCLPGHRLGLAPGIPGGWRHATACLPTSPSGPLAVSFVRHGLHCPPTRGLTTGTGGCDRARFVPWKGGPESGRCHPVLGGRGQDTEASEAGSGGTPLECSEARLRPGGSCGGRALPLLLGVEAPGWDMTRPPWAPGSQDTEHGTRAHKHRDEWAQSTGRGHTQSQLDTQTRRATRTEDTEATECAGTGRAFWHDCTGIVRRGRWGRPAGTGLSPSSTLC